MSTVTNQEIDDGILASLHPEIWRTAEEINSSLWVLNLRGVGTQKVGARLRSLKSRGLAESQVHNLGYYSEWRKT